MESRIRIAAHNNGMVPIYYLHEKILSFRSTSDYREAKLRLICNYPHYPSVLSRKLGLIRQS